MNIRQTLKTFNEKLSIEFSVTRDPTHRARLEDLIRKVQAAMMTSGMFSNIFGDFNGKV